MSELFQALGTRLEGLTQEEAQNQLQIIGPNEITAKKPTPYIIQFLEEFKNLMVVILLVATIIAFLLGETIDALIILFIIVLNAFIGFLQKFKAEKAIQALKKLIAPTAKVLRNGQMHKIPARELVPGDILVLEEGDQIGADAVLFEENELETQEAVLTGESTSVEKNAFTFHTETNSNKNVQEQAFTYLPENLIFMGTCVTHGTGKAVVIKTGMQTEMGKIATLTTETQKDKSPLEKELDTIGVFVGKVTFAITAVLFLYGFLLQHREFIDTLLFSISVAVAAVPEGLPTTITIALAIGIQKLAKNNAIIKQLSSVETLGATTVICSDKTGTLTKNEMTVKELYVDNYYGQITGVGYAPSGDIHIEQNGGLPFTLSAMSDQNEGDGKSCLHQVKKKSPQLYHSLSLLLQTAGLCNNAAIRKTDDHFEIVGDPTEGALLTLILKSGIDLELLKDQFEKLHEYPFDSTRKRMTVLMRDKENGKIFAFTKGAPQNILAISDHVYLNQKAVKFDPQTKKDVMNKNESLAEKALRVLAFAYRELTPHEQKTLEKALQKGQKTPLKKEAMENGLTFLGLTGMIDPPRPEIQSAIELCRKAGIKIIIITGDYGVTAQAIAEQLGLFDQPTKIKKDGNDLEEKNNPKSLRHMTNLVINGNELDQMSEDELKKLLQGKSLQIIFARVSPEHKLRIVSALKVLGEIVAVTGDGVNDAPALKRSDIGVAMGSGTDVSKEASNMILTDNSFSTIVKAIQEGRTIYENLRKFIFFIFSSNIGELFAIFIAIILALPSPLTAIMILFINLFTDILPALALSVEPTTHDVMSKKPRRPESKILNRVFIGRIIILGLAMGIITISLFIFQLFEHGWSWGKALNMESMNYLKASTMAFVAMVMIQMANAFNAKHEHLPLFKINPLNNWKLLGAIAISIFLTILMVELPLLQPFIHTVHLDIKDWVIIGIGSISIIFIEEIRKYLVRQSMDYRISP